MLDPLYREIKCNNQFNEYTVNMKIEKNEDAYAIFLVDSELLYL